ncbi:MAG TPA: Gfo/Idh/MocA family oxidoreductase [Dermatophilaceae bacterium]|nr:Gfo/Idh/MocA family oxidoreductase [Dermatophilaceae bacterium]
MTSAAPPRTVGIGIVGGGLMGREIAAAIQRWPALVDHPARPHLVGVADINPAALGWFDQIETVRATTTDYRDLLAEPDVDVVYIAVRHDLHEQLYVDTVRAGKDLLAEKPFGIDGRAADAILAAVETSACFVRVSSEMPFFPGAQHVVSLARSGSLGKVIEVESGFLHSSDYDPDKPINWKRQVRFCGRAGVMNDLGLHAWHVPLRLGFSPSSVYAVLQDIVRTRPGPGGDAVECDTIDNAILTALVGAGDDAFPLRVETKRIAPGESNTWRIRIVGLDGAAEYSTAEPKTVRLLDRRVQPNAWQSLQTGSQSVWPTVTGGIFEFGFSDAILQMLATFLAEREGALEGRFGCATPQEAWLTHRIFEAAWDSQVQQRAVAPRLGR